MTPIFSRSWLMKIRHVLLLATMEVSLRRAWLMRRACRPIWASPISPSSSERGVEGEGAGRDRGHVHLLAAPQAHDRALAELLVDLRQGGLDRPGPLVSVFNSHMHLSRAGRPYDPGHDRRILSAGAARPGPT